MTFKEIIKFERGIYMPEARHAMMMYFLLASGLVIIVAGAWVSDDAYITFRTIDNFVNGYGLRWNVAERVQSYTHPLWMLIMSAANFVTGEFFYTSVFVSVAFSFAALCVFAFKIAPTRFAAVIGLCMLIFSKAFLDYSTSGLENPVTHLLIAAFMFLYIKEDWSGKNIFWMSLVAALAMTNRMDTALLFFFPLAYALYKNRGREGVLYAALGLVPFFVWEAFSLIYYGFLFPNTAYAKLNTGIPKAILFVQGLHYIERALFDDTVTVAVIAAAVVFPFIKRSVPMIMAGMGIALYIVYVAKVGGDFMAGRFLAAPFFLAVTVVTPALFREFDKRKFLILFLPLVLATAFCYRYVSGVNLRSDIFSGVDRYGIADERLFYVRNWGLFLYQRDGAGDVDRYAYVSDVVKAAGGGKTFVSLSLGRLGFYAGPGVHILDMVALTDPLLARLPASKHYTQRIGHFIRRIPANYFETVDSGKNTMTDKNLALYYDKLGLVTRGPIFGDGRFSEILKFNTGRNEALVDRAYYMDVKDMEDSKYIKLLLVYKE